MPPRGAAHVATKVTAAQHSSLLARWTSSAAGLIALQAHPASASELEQPAILDALEFWNKHLNADAVHTAAAFVSSLLPGFDTTGSKLAGPAQRPLSSILRSCHRATVPTPLPLPSSMAATAPTPASQLHRGHRASAAAAAP
jgi:hypothetical protein